MLTTNGLARLSALGMVVLAVVAAPWALRGGLSLIGGRGWSVHPPVATLLGVAVYALLAAGFAAAVWRSKRMAWLWLIPFFCLMVASPPGVMVLYLLPLLVGLMAAVIMALPLPATE